MSTGGVSEHKLCQLDELDDPSGKAFVLSEGASASSIVVVRKGEKVFGYVNACPHLTTTLDMISDDIFDEAATLLVCSFHGAQFRIDDGVCIGGPCTGDKLQPYPLVVRDGNVYAQG